MAEKSESRPLTRLPELIEAFSRWQAPQLGAVMMCMNGFVDSLPALVQAICRTGALGVRCGPTCWIVFSGWSVFSTKSAEMDASSSTAPAAPSAHAAHRRARAARRAIALRGPPDAACAAAALSCGALPAPSPWCAGRCPL
eukprot:SAG22_NODE_1419_length_4466_cov_5.588963_5_plen_141_part_00